VEGKRGEIEPEDFSDNLRIRLGLGTEVLNRHWDEKNTGLGVIDVRRQAFQAFTVGREKSPKRLSGYRFFRPGGILQASVTLRRRKLAISLKS